MSQREWKNSTEELLARWRELQQEGTDPASTVAQEQAVAHLRWFAEIPGTPTHTGDEVGSTAMVLGVADLYETNPDFHVTFGGEAAAKFAADTLRTHVQSTS